MLFLLTSPDLKALPLAGILAADEDRQLLLTGDAVYLAAKRMAGKLPPWGFDTVYAEKEALEDRGIEAASDCSVADMEKIVEIVVQNGKVINL